MSTSLHAPRANPSPKPSRFRDRRHAKALFLIVGLELVLVAGLLTWIMATRPADKLTIKLPLAQQPSAQQNTKPSKVDLKLFAEGLAAPTTIAALPDANDHRLFVTEQGGTVRIVGADGKVDATPFLDISAKVQNKGEMGLLGLAFHPKVASNNYLFVDYIDKQQNTIVARYTISRQTGRAMADSEKVLIKLAQPYANHNGGQLAFGPDGYLYIGLGDGGSAGDPENRAQNKNELLGKLLRIDVDKGNPYAIPASNPFAKASGARPEIWAYGLRNPWRFSFDRQSGDLYIADVGQGNIEEIDFQKADSKGGDNYGWRCYEGAAAFNTEGCQAASNYTTPVLSYDHSEGRCSVTGGYVYRGSAFPGLAGKYFYGDYCSGQVYYTQNTGSTWEAVPAATTQLAISTFGQDSAGELYVADLNSGRIYQLQETVQ